jgi:hypothetical protein
MSTTIFYGGDESHPNKEISASALRAVNRLRIPQVADHTALTPAEGLLVENTTLDKIYIYSGAAWREVGASVTIDATPTDGSTNAVQSNGVFDALAAKQATLVSGTNITTVNGTSLLGSGNLQIVPTGGLATQVLTKNSSTNYDYSWLTPSATNWNGQYNGVANISSTTTMTNATQAYCFTGASPATWTLPALSGNSGRYFTVKNRGSATLTIQRAGSDNLWDSASVTSITLTAGEWCILWADASYWHVQKPGSGSVSEPSTQIAYGTGTGIDSSSDLTYDSSTKEFKVRGSVHHAVTNVTDADYTILTSDYYLELAEAGALRTITLPASPAAGRVLWIRNEHSTPWAFNSAVLLEDGSNSTEIPTQAEVKLIYNTAWKMFRGGSSTTEAFESLTDGATITWDYTTGAKKYVTLGGNRTLDLQNTVDGDTGILKVTQDGTGSRTLSLTGNTPAGWALTTAAGSSSVLGFINISGTIYWSKENY